jgi:hypothetical protein
VVALKGNHEAFAIGGVDGDIEPEFWLREGGAATLRCYLDVNSVNDECQNALPSSTLILLLYT